MDAFDGSDFSAGAASHGPPPRPEGEKSSDTPDSSGEASRSTLAKTKARRPRKTRRRSNTNPPPSKDGGSNGAASAEKSEPKTIVRATSKLRLHVGANKELRDLLHDTQRACARVLNVCTRRLWSLDAEAIDANNGVPPKPWPIPKVDGAIAATGLYRLSGRIAPELPGAMRSVLSLRASEKWMEKRWNALVRMKERPPHFRDNAPIPLRAADVKILHEEVADKKGFLRDRYRLNFALRSGHGQRVTVPIWVKDNWQRQLMSKISSGEWRHGEISLLRDRRNRWYARIAYKRQIETTSAVKRVAINRGIKWFLVAAADDGQTWRYPGADIVAYLKQVQSRRQGYQRDIVASRRAGHGRKRSLRPIEHLQGKAERWRETKCQTIARRFANWCRDRGYGKVIIEDFSGIRDGEPEKVGGKVIWDLIQSWPYYQLQMRIVSCLEEYGIETVTQNPKFISQRCPHCGTVDKEQRDLRRWLLRCQNPACGRKEHLDVAAARNLLHREKFGDDTPPLAKDRKKMSGAKGAKKTARKAPRSSLKTKKKESKGRKR